MKKIIIGLLALGSLSVFASANSEVTCSVGYDRNHDGGFWIQYEETVKSNGNASFKAILKNKKTGAPEDIYFGAEVTNEALTSVYLMTNNSKLEVKELVFPMSNKIDLTLISKRNKETTAYRVLCFKH